MKERCDFDRLLTFGLLLTLICAMPPGAIAADAKLSPRLDRARPGYDAQAVFKLLGLRPIDVDSEHSLQGDRLTGMPRRAMHKMEPTAAATIANGDDQAGDPFSLGLNGPGDGLPVHRSPPTPDDSRARLAPDWAINWAAAADGTFAVPAESAREAPAAHASADEPTATPIEAAVTEPPPAGRSKSSDPLPESGLNEPRQSAPSFAALESAEVWSGPPPVAAANIADYSRQLVDDGIQLARRGAFYSARSKFVRVLRLITQSFDAQRHTQQYSRSLARGLKALEEAGDFRPKGARLEGELNLKHIVNSHHTQVLKQADLRSLSVVQALQQYHHYAETQLIQALGREAAAADALLALGKLQSHLSIGRRDVDTTADARAMSMYQAALAISPVHHQAANELGVLFARYGQWKEARAVLRQSVRERRNSPEVWLNLAKVHQQLGEFELARLASEEWELATSSNRRAAPPDHPDVQWVAPETFAAMSDPSARVSRQQGRVDAATEDSGVSAASEPKKSSSGRRRPSAQQRPLSMRQRYAR